MNDSLHNQFYLVFIMIVNWVQLKDYYKMDKKLKFYSLQLSFINSQKVPWYCDISKVYLILSKCILLFAVEVVIFVSKVAYRHPRGE